MDKIPMTRAGAEALDQELKNLKSVERPAVIQAISEAREHGDLKENAEYHAAKERQSFIEGRIQELEAVTSAVQIIDPASFSGNVIRFGAKVVIVDENTDAEQKLQIVGHYESNADKGLISLQAPMARALIGKSKGDSAEVRTPQGVKSYEILEVTYE